MKNLLNVMVWISLITVILSACMVDSPSMVPAFICAGSVAVLGITCLIREKLC